MQYNEAVEYLCGLKKFAKGTGVDRERQLLKRLGNPELEQKVIHIAGSNGKGSVCSYLEIILRKQGYSTGLFISPHLVSINERIKINNQDVNNETFMYAFEKVYEASKRLQSEGFEGAAFFDFITAMALLIFKKYKVDYVIMETGLGGRLDCTRAVENTIANVITSISLEHTQILGDTIEQIAFEKAGIIRKNTPVIFIDNNAEATKVIEEYAKRRDCNVHKVSSYKKDDFKTVSKYIDFYYDNGYYRNSLFSIKTAGVYQVDNCRLALETIAAMDINKEFDEAKIHEAVADMYFGGRMEALGEDIYIDGAHNTDGIRAFLESASNLTDNNMMKIKKYLLFSVVEDKDYTHMIKQICDSDMFEEYILLQMSNNRAYSIESMQEIFKNYTTKKVSCFTSAKQAFMYAVNTKGKNSVLFIAGSLYLAGEIKQLIADNSIQNNNILNNNSQDNNIQEE